MRQSTHIRDINYLAIKIASPEEILEWSYGEVIKPETLNYRTQRPEKDGLFSERIFGPTKDYECYCGKYKKVRYKGVVCERCGVEVTRSNVRRERMGHVKLASPVINIWFLKTVPSKLSSMLDVPVSKLERVVYYAAYIVTTVAEDRRKQAIQVINEEYKALKAKKEVDDKELKGMREHSKEILRALYPGMVLSEEEYYYLSQKFGEVFEAGRGAEALQKLLKNVELEKLVRKLEEEVKHTNDAGRRKKILHRLKLSRAFIRSKTKPEWMIMTVVPVLPPELRPMVALDGGRYATADLNDLYRRVINRNNRLKKLIDLNSPDVILTNEKRMLQEAVDALIDNNARTGSQVLSTRRRPLKSLADMLKGKQGRFRQNLLGKRVDYSARSVIVVGPDLKLNQCGLPKNLALEIFRPFVINKIIEGGIAYNIKQANRYIEQGIPEVWAALEEVIENKMVLLNRAPTLHRLGIQAFKPILIEDLAIRIHPLVCAAFNADFDGDQMAVHLPLTEEAQYECRELMDASKNLLKPSSGEPIVSPTQDIVLGVYYLTRVRKGRSMDIVFSTFGEALLAFEQGLIDHDALIKISMEGDIVETTYGRLVFNRILPDDFAFVNEHLGKKGLTEIAARIISQYGASNAHEYLDRIKDLGFKYSTYSSVSFGITDVGIPKEKERLIGDAEKEVVEIESQFEEGLLTKREREERVISIWTRARERVGKAVLDDMGVENPIYTIIASKARGSWAQSNQIMGMRGLVANPRGETIELPVKSSYKEGLNVLEYFMSTHGARKGLTDTALKTASAGYLTRRLVDVAQDLIVYEKDCRTREGLEIIRAEGDEYGHTLARRLYTRTAADDIKIGRKIIVKSGETIEKETARKIEEADIPSVKVRSPITCKTLYGVCSKCYGWDLTKETMVREGEAVGIVAAQSIGEPGTQLTMRTFHVGGIAGVDITHGLPRVEEVFEVRIPKGQAIMNKTDGTVQSIIEKSTMRIIEVVEDKIGRKKATVNEYSIPRGVRLFVKKNDRVIQGQLLSEGPADLREVLTYNGLEALKRYIINEVQRIYVPEGAVINDKHIEVIVRQMLSRVVIKDSGDTDFTIGDIVDKSRLREINKEIKSKGGQPAKSVQHVLGVTKVALTTESFLSAASFQETSRVLVNAAVEGKIDILRGLKESVIIGKLIPAGTGLRGIPKEALPQELSEVSFGPRTDKVEEPSKTNVVRKEG